MKTKLTTDEIVAIRKNLEKSIHWYQDYILINNTIREALESCRGYMSWTSRIEAVVEEKIVALGFSCVVKYETSKYMGDGQIRIQVWSGPHVIAYSNLIGYHFTCARSDWHKIIADFDENSDRTKSIIKGEENHKKEWEKLTDIIEDYEAILQHIGTFNRNYGHKDNDDYSVTYTLKANLPLLDVRL
jgi:hypothetical protein